MIGKGAQYLTAAGFGRYRITAASLGSLVMLGKFWLTAATKQAIMAAFGVDGTAVIAATNDYLNGIAASDKAKATALAGFINEDPMMVCSIVDTPKYRGLITVGGAWFQTDFVATGGMLAYMGVKPVSGKTFQIGSHNTSAQGGTNNYNRNIIFGNKTTNRVGAEVLNVLSNNTLDGKLDYTIYNDLELCTYGTPYFKVNGNLKTLSNPSGTLAPQTPVVIDYGQYGGSPTDSEGVGISYLTLYDKDGNLARTYVPFKRNNVMELLDLETGTLATRTGTFTEELLNTPTP
jgi:hypothetical protein